MQENHQIGTSSWGVGARREAGESGRWERGIGAGEKQRERERKMGVSGGGGGETSQATEAAVMPVNRCGPFGRPPVISVG